MRLMMVMMLKYNSNDNLGVLVLFFSSQFPLKILNICSQETSSLKKDLERLEKKSKELKERIKGKLGAIPGLGDDNQDDEEGNE